MALPPALADPVFTRTVSLLRNNRGVVDLRELAADFWRADRGIPPRNISEYRAVVNRADAAYRAGITLEGMPAGILQPGSHAQDPTIRPGEPSYAYRTIVQVRYGRGNQVETLVIVRSSQPLASDDIRQRAAQLVRTTIIPTDRGRRARANIDQGTTRSFIITAGVR